MMALAPWALALPAPQAMTPGVIVQTEGRSMTVQAEGQTFNLRWSPWTPLLLGETKVWLPASLIKPGQRIRFQAQGAMLAMARIDAEVEPARPSASSTAVLDPDRASAEALTVPMVMPIPGFPAPQDTWLAPRSGGRRHLGQDLMAPRLTPIIAPFAGEVSLFTSSAQPPHYYLRLQATDGWLAWAMHLNNDSAGTDDGVGGPDLAFAPGLKTGDWVGPGQLLGWVGDSGNSEETAPHLHFELWHQPTNAALNPIHSLRAARVLPSPLAWNPAPDLELATGEERWDGVVAGVDPTRNLAEIRLISSQSAGQAPAAAGPGARRWVRLDQARLAAHDGFLLGDLAGLATGMRILALGSAPVAGQGLAAQLVVSFSPPL
jgi:hypothetical protein